MDTQGQTSWLLDPRLRNVLEQYIANRCLMLRYTLSRVCRALWYRLRNEHFLRFAQVVSGHAILREDEEPSFKEECVRWIYPDVVLGYQFLGGFEHNFWGLMQMEHRQARHYSLRGLLFGCKANGTASTYVHSHTMGVWFTCL